MPADIADAVKRSADHRCQDQYRVDHRFHLMGW
jgi:hypothetical protein